MPDSFVFRLSWDSVFFGRSISALDIGRFVDARGPNVEPASGGLIQAKIPAGNTTALDLAQHCGFRFVEGEAIFEKRLESAIASAPPCRRAERSELPAVMALASESFFHSRFREPWFRRDDASRLYGEWARKAVLSEHDDICLVDDSGVGGALVGLITAKLDAGVGSARIGLLCVTPERRGCGIAKRLLAGVEAWGCGQGALLMRVATQLSNLTASRLYLGNGYLLLSASYWFYK